MAFINKILQKTKSKIGDRDSGGSTTGTASPEKMSLHHLDSPTDGVPGLPMSPGITQAFNTALSQPLSAGHPPPQQQHPSMYSTGTMAPVQKHMVPSNAPMVLPTSTNVATRAASFSLSVQSASNPPASAYAGHAQGPYLSLQQQQQQLYNQHYQAYPQHQQQVPTAYPQYHYQQQQQQQQPPPPPLVPMPPPPLPSFDAPASGTHNIDRSYDDTHVRLDEFEVFRTVGTGSFGRVRL
ncbi:hypothetical protein H4S07_004751, partial [Coemansia furcata]